MAAVSRPTNSAPRQSRRQCAASRRPAAAERVAIPWVARLEHVERRARHVPGFDGFGERDLVDQLAASGVDDPHPALALGEPRPVEKMARFCRRGKMEADVIGDFAHAVEAEQLDAKRGSNVFGNERPCATVSIWKARSSRDFLSDPSEPAEPEGLAAKFRAGQFLCPTLRASS